MRKIRKTLLFLLIVVIIFYGPVTRIINNKTSKGNDNSSITSSRLYVDLRNATGEAFRKVSDTVSEVIATIEKESSGGAENLETNEYNLIKAELVRVVDGDTILVKIDGEKKKVRLLCINTEESVHEDETKNNEFGKAASKWLTKYLEDVKEVWLEYDTECQDEYGRELCYVWLTDSPSGNDLAEEMLNCKLVEQGYAYKYVFEPNTRYAESIASLQEAAKMSKAGLWNDNVFVDIAESKER